MKKVKPDIGRIVWSMDLFRNCYSGESERTPLYEIFERRGWFHVRYHECVEVKIARTLDDAKDYVFRQFNSEN